jgi:hypothetical protein
MYCRMRAFDELEESLVGVGDASSSADAHAFPMRSSYVLNISMVNGCRALLTVQNFCAN